MTTRREFIKILTGTVVAIALPVGLFPKTEKPIDLSNVEFTLARIEFDPMTKDYAWMMRGLGIPKDQRIPPAYFGVRIDDIDNYDKEALLEEIKSSLSEHFKNRRVEYV